MPGSREAPPRGCGAGLSTFAPAAVGGRLAKAWGNATAAPGCDGAASRGIRAGIVGARDT